MQSPCMGLCVCVGEPPLYQTKPLTVNKSVNHKPLPHNDLRKILKPTVNFPKIDNSPIDTDLNKFLNTTHKTL